MPNKHKRSLGALLKDCCKKNFNAKTFECPCNCEYGFFCHDILTMEPFYWDSEQLRNFNKGIKKLQGD